MVRVMRLLRSAIFISVASLVITGSSNTACSADMLIFNNKERVEGTILQETDGEVTIDVGEGVITFSKDSIASIQCDSTTSGVQQTYTSRSITPSRSLGTIEKLYRQFGKLQRERRRAFATRKKINELFARYISDAAAYRALGKVHSDIERQMKERHAVGDLRAYKILSRERDEIAKKRIKLRTRGRAVLETKGWQENELFSIIHRIYTSRHELGERLAEVFDDALTQEERYLLTELVRDYQGISNEFIKKECIYIKGSEGPLVTAVLNGKVTTSLRIDPESPVVMISHKLADAIGVYDPFNDEEIMTTHEEHEEIVETILKPKVIMSIRVGAATVNNLNAIVTEEFPDVDVSGVLGIPFLCNYVLEIDEESRTIVLYEFAPTAVGSQES